ncbi:phage holin family protein [Bacillus sp. 1P06AnD]|uniref:phage holin family protein n=1 Tax=Bacillus sp. 1P06AnD TaxID=3132208 RepID=UPI00399F3B17
MFIIRFLISGLALLGIDYVLPGITIEDYKTALIAVFIIGILNIFVKPILHLLSLPITLLTFGLFSFVINALIFFLASQFISGFTVSSFWGALLGSILLSLVQSALRGKD